jgi:pilus assembly protein CpaB
MKRAQLIVLGIALTAGLAAMFLAGGSSETPQPTSSPVAAIAPTKMTDVLIAAVDIPMGSTVGLNDLRWQAWPADAAPPFLIKRADTPNATTELAGSIARIGFVSGEPMRKEKLIRADGSGFMSAILPAGMRAVAITIDTRGSNSAGGFILPNDRVDILRTYRDDESTRSQGSDVYISETILRNIRVLAIGQNVQEKDGQKVVVGETATLELDPRQAETVTLAQRVGQLSLALRSIADANKQATDDTSKPKDNGLTVVRFGISKQSTKQ